VPLRIFKQHPEHESIVIDDCLDAVTRAASRVASRVDILLGRTTVENLQETRKIHAKVTETHLGLQMAVDSIFEIRKSQAENEERASAREESTLQHLQDLAATFQENFESAMAQLSQTIEAQTLHTVLQSLIETGLLAVNSSHRAVAGMHVH
jgi:response regulator of citrate/malate metabolism